MKTHTLYCIVICLQSMKANELAFEVVFNLGMCCIYLKALHSRIYFCAVGYITSHYEIDQKTVKIRQSCNMVPGLDGVITPPCANCKLNISMTICHNLFIVQMKHVTVSRAVSQHTSHILVILILCIRAVWFHHPYKNCFVS